jgi:hypothetical protein
MGGELGKLKLVSAEVEGDFDDGDMGAGIQPSVPATKLMAEVEKGGGSVNDASINIDNAEGNGIATADNDDGSNDNGDGSNDKDNKDADVDDGEDEDEDDEDEDEDEDEDMDDDNFGNPGLEDSFLLPTDADDEDEMIAEAETAEADLAVREDAIKDTTASLVRTLTSLCAVAEVVPGAFSAMFDWNAVLASATPLFFLLGSADGDTALGGPGGAGSGAHLLAEVSRLLLAIEDSRPGALGPAADVLLRAVLECGQDALRSLGAAIADAYGVGAGARATALRLAADGAAPVAVRSAALSLIVTALTMDTAAAANAAPAPAADSGATATEFESAASEAIRAAMFAASHRARAAARTAFWGVAAANPAAGATMFETFGERMQRIICREADVASEVTTPEVRARFACPAI